MNIAEIQLALDKHDLQLVDKPPNGEILVQQKTQLEQEASCFCHDGVSLQSVSGGAASEGYLGKVTLLIDGEYVDYVKAQPEQQAEPVAWRYALDASVEGPRWIYIDKDPHQWLKGPSMANAVIETLYTTPPQRQWVGLTDEEILRADPRFGKSESDVNPYQILGSARDLEAKLKERNT